MAKYSYHGHGRITMVRDPKTNTYKTVYSEFQLGYNGNEVYGRSQEEVQRKIQQYKPSIRDRLYLIWYLILDIYEALTSGFRKKKKKDEDDLYY